MCKFAATDWKNCATCRFWRGPRKLTELHTAADVEPSACGGCARDASDHRHYATSSCIRWQAWGAIA